MAFQADHYAGEIHLYPTTLRDPANFTPNFMYIMISSCHGCILPTACTDIPPMPRPTPTRGSQHRKTDYASSARTELPRVSAMVT